MGLSLDVLLLPLSKCFVIIAHMIVLKIVARSQSNFRNTRTFSEQRWKMSLMIEKFKSYCENWVQPSTRSLPIQSFPKKVKFNEATELLSNYFGEETSLFNDRFRCLTIFERPETFSSRLNSEFERTDFQNVSNNKLKCLLYVCSFTSPEDADFRSGHLKWIEKEPKITFPDVVTGRHRIESLKDMVFIQNAHKQTKISTVIQSAITNQILQNGIFIHPPHLYLLVGFTMNNIFPSSVHSSSMCQHCGKRGH